MSNEDFSKEEKSDVGNKMHRQKTITNTANKKQTKKSKLLSNPDVKRWYSNVARGSIVTAEVRLRRLGGFCEEHEMTPTELIQIGLKDSKAIADLLQDHISGMEEHEKAPQYIKTTITAVKSWLSHFDIEVKRKLRISNVDSTPTLQDERVPEANELAELFTRARLREGAIMAFIAKSGLRPEVLGNFDASDGLRIKDLPELAFVKGEACFLKKPSRVMVRKSLSKAGHEYFSFVTELEEKWILAYLNDRIASGDALGPEEPVIKPLSKSAKGKFVSSAIIERDVRNAMRPRFKWRPYVLRAFFDTQLLIAESRGKVAHDFRVFWMGHKGSIEAKYTTNKSILSMALIDEMKASFLRCQEFLDLEKEQVDMLEEDMKDKVKDDVERLSGDELVEVQEYVRNKIYCKSSTGKK